MTIPSTPYKLLVALGLMVLVAAACTEQQELAILAELSDDLEVILSTEDSEPPNNPPEVMEGQEFDIDENSPAGTEVGTIIASDVDGDPLSYIITGGAGSSDFTIDLDNGLISVVNPPDFEEQPSYVLTVEVSDGLATDSGQVDININDLVGANISGGVFVDLDVDGERDDGEPPLSGATVTLTTDGNSTETATNSSGEYSFEAFMAGTYLITETDPEGRASTNAVPGVDASKVDANTLRIDDITEDDILNQIQFTDNLFLDTIPLPKVYTITGWVWEDENCDGSFDINEPGLAGTVVSLSSGLTQTTASDGVFLLYGPEEVITVTATHPDGYVPTNAIPGDAAVKNDNVTLVVDVFQLDDEDEQTSRDNLFGAGLPPNPATISGTVFDDENCNGVFDGGETGLQGVSITMDTQGGDTFVTQTNSNGYYEFVQDCSPCGGGCEGGSITSSGPGGLFFPTTPETFFLALTGGGEYPNNNFGYSDGCPP